MALERCPHDRILTDDRLYGDDVDYQGDTLLEGFYLDHITVWQVGDALQG